VCMCVYVYSKKGNVVSRLFQSISSFLIAVLASVVMLKSGYRHKKERRQMKCTRQHLLYYWKKQLKLVVYLNVYSISVTILCL